MAFADDAMNINHVWNEDYSCMLISTYQCCLYIHCISSLVCSLVRCMSLHLRLVLHTINMPDL